MKKVILILVLLPLLVGCNKIEIENQNEDTSKQVEEISNMKVLIDNKEYMINLEDNETVDNLKSKLPLDLNMNDLNNNEKYVYLDFNLPTNEKKVNTINKGDVMLFGSNCLVIFYKTFNTSYSYTKIGHIDNLDISHNNNINVRLLNE